MFLSPIALAFALDLLLGDPVFPLHPVRLLGRLISFLETGLPRTRSGGLALVSAVLALSLLAGFLFCHLAGPFEWAMQAILIYFCLSMKDMLSHVQVVLLQLEAKDLPAARLSVAKIVGRDTGDLDEAGICRACIESTAESFSDGFFAPLFYAYLGTAVLAFLFKAISTMDSMLGYKNERYKDLGWAAARLDDLANYIPSRLSVLLIGLSSWKLRECYRTAFRDAPKQPSPNSGWPEAAFAAALGLKLGGTLRYAGQESLKADLGEGSRALDPAAVREALLLFQKSAWLALLIGEILWHWI